MALQEGDQHDLQVYLYILCTLLFRFVNIHQFIHVQRHNLEVALSHYHQEASLQCSWTHATSL